MLLGDQQLEVGALRIGPVDARGVHVDRQGHRMGIEGRVPLIDDAAQQQQQEADRHPDGQQTIQLEATLAGIAPLQACAEATDTSGLFGAYGTGLGRRRVSHIAADRSGRCAGR